MYMKLYHYLLFTIYSFFADVVRDEDPWLPTWVASSTLLFVNILIFCMIIENHTTVNLSLSRIDIVLVMTLILILNYFLNFRSLSFLSYEFDFDRKALITLILYVFVTFALIVFLR